MIALKLKDYDMSPECGFLPTSSPSEAQLPEVFRQLQETAVLLPKWLTTDKIRQVSKNLPEVDVAQETLDEMQFCRLMLLYSFLTHAYVWEEPTPCQNTTAQPCNYTSKIQKRFEVNQSEGNKDNVAITKNTRL